MENLNNSLENSRKISEHIAQEFQKINQHAKQELLKINQKMEGVFVNSEESTRLEEKIVLSGQDGIDMRNLEKSIESSMKNWDIQKLNQEELSSLEPKETKEIVSNVMLDEKIIQLCKEKSVKPKTKIKKKAKKKNLNVAEFILVTGVSIGAIATPVVAHAINTAYPNQMIEEATENYKENIFNPNTEKFYNQEKEDIDHTHDLIDIMVETKEEYENPIVGFYLVYNNLDKYCKKYKLEDIFYNFNLVYKTDYTSLEDFLQKNNFKNSKEFEEYVGYELSCLTEEERGRGM